MGIDHYREYFSKFKTDTIESPKLAEPNRDYSVTTVIVGWHEWDNYTGPLIESIKRTNPQINILVVDNGSEPPYPQVDGATIIRSEENLGLAGGTNFGWQHAPESDWYIILNNDVLFHKPIADRVSYLCPDTMYGFFMRPALPDQFDWAYLSMWCLFIPHAIYKAVGDFDASLFPMYWEDADYSKRVADTGFRLGLEAREEWGIEHLMDERKQQRVDYFNKNYEHIVKLRDYVRAKYAG